jgi:hypothetical protein
MYPDGIYAAHKMTFQYYLGNQYGRRRWEYIRQNYPSKMATDVDDSLESKAVRDSLGYLDYIRGATDRVKRTKPRVAE